MTRAKAKRRNAILQLIGSRSIRTHDDLAQALSDEGIDISLATLSRDLRELGIAKVAAGYEVLSQAGSSAKAQQALERAVAEFLLESNPAGNLVVLRTPPGGANALARCLDTAGWADVVGTIAGDDTIFIATPDHDTALRVSQRLIGS